MISLLQQRMDKCTSEQFWTVAALTAADGFLLTNGWDLEKRFSYGGIMLVLTVLTCWGIWIIVERHKYYFISQRDLKALHLL